MRVFGKIVQWFFVGVFVILALATGFHISSFFFILAAALMMPIKPFRDLLKKIKIKSGLAIVLSIATLFTGVMLTPVGSFDNDDYELPDYEYTVSATEDKVTEATTETPTTVAPTETTTETPITAPPTAASVGNGQVEKVNPSSIPAYSGTAYTVINNNVPNFSSSELTTKAYEKYSSLDSHGRCGVALASCGTEIMPADGEERGSISSIKPTGWVQAKYTGISGGYLWNRCHLIGWQLSAENANKSNLITGTRYMNIEGMLTFENMVADYIKETGNHVAYRVTPVFEGSNLVCSGVQMEAYSIEDSGDGICFNVYCYNVQPGITIDYATGKSSGPNVEPETEAPKVEEPEDNNDYNSSSGTMVWIPQSGSKYHSRANCSNMKNPTQVTEEEAEAMGYEPCKRCH